MELLCSYQHVWILLWPRQQPSTRTREKVSRTFKFYHQKKPCPRTELFPDQPAERIHCLQQQHRLPRHFQYSCGSPPPSFQTTYPTASVWSLQMHLSIRKLWIMVYRLCCHYLYIHRVSASNHLGDQVSHGEEEVKGGRSRPYQITADVDPNEQYDGHLFCECSNNSCYGPDLPTDQSESGNPLPRFDEQITANHNQTILKRRQLMTTQKEIGLHSESVTLCTGKFFQNFAPPPRVRNIFGIIIVTPG